MPEDISDIKIFEIVYNKHPNEPMSFIQEEALKMQIALHHNKLYMKHYVDETPSMLPGESAKPIEAGDDKAKKALVQADVPDVSQWAINDPEAMKNSVGVDTITCCICGKQMTMMSRHLDSHGISKEEYKRLVGLPPKTPLMSKGYYAQISARMSSPRKKAEPQQETPMPDIHTV